jgi:hypothetical protein
LFRGGLRVVGASGLLLAGRARRFLFFSSVSPSKMMPPLVFASGCLKFDQNLKHLEVWGLCRYCGGVNVEQRHRDNV